MFASLLAAAIAATPATLAEHQAACRGKDGWNDPAPPVRIFGNVYQVGTCGIVVLLVAGPKGHILIDAATAEAAPAIIRNIEALGLKLRDVRVILASHEHSDHVGGLAALQRSTGATLRLSPPATRVLASGEVDRADPQHGLIAPPPPASPGKPLRDRETVSVGPLRLTAHFTPGHSAGGTSWTWRECEGHRCRRMVYADSLTAVSAKGYRFTAHPERIAALQQSFNTVAALPCELLITPHPAASRLYQRLAGTVQPHLAGECRAYAAKAHAAFAERVAAERAR
jgi:metallo-beta-lactamase class B